MLPRMYECCYLYIYEYMLVRFRIQGISLSEYLWLTILCCSCCCCFVLFLANYKCNIAMAIAAGKTRDCTELIMPGGFLLCLYTYIYFFQPGCHSVAVDCADTRQVVQLGHFLFNSAPQKLAQPVLKSKHTHTHSHMQTRGHWHSQSQSKDVETKVKATMAKCQIHVRFARAPSYALHARPCPGGQRQLPRLAAG